jgi:hypothetical protein
MRPHPNLPLMVRQAHHPEFIEGQGKGPAFV